MAFRLATVKIGRKVVSEMTKSRAVLEKYIDERTPIYGVSTQFGTEVRYLDKNLKKGSKKYQASLTERQDNLIASHNIGVGEVVPSVAVRASILMRTQSLAQGYSGVRPEVVEGLTALLNKGVTPVIHRYGSIGASGDLIPLSSIAATLSGQNTSVEYAGKIMNAPLALKKAQITPVKIESKEGLALINGTSFMTGITSVYLYKLVGLYDDMMCAIAMALEALQVIESAYLPKVHTLKNHKGEIEVSAQLRELWKGSKLVQDLREQQKKALENVGDTNGAYHQKYKLQDYYSIRSVAQGFGTFNENLKLAVRWVEEEMNSVNDNPIIDRDTGKIYHAANFMGYYITQACDTLKMEISQASSWIHALVADLVHSRKSYGLPTNLVKQPEIHNGFRPIQILTASIAVQNRKLAQSQQSFMLPTEGDNQDVNSLGAHAAYDFKEAVNNLEQLTAILYLAAAQAIDLRGRDHASVKARNTVNIIRETVPFIEADRQFSSDIASIVGLINENQLR